VVFAIGSHRSWDPSALAGAGAILAVCCGAVAVAVGVPTVARLTTMMLAALRPARTRRMRGSLGVATRRPHRPSRLSERSSTIRGARRLQEPSRTGPDSLVRHAVCVVP